MFFNKGNNVFAINQIHDCCGQLIEVVWRDVRRHPHRNPTGAIEQQVWQAGWQNIWLLQRAVKVVYPFNRIFFDVGQQFFSHLIQTGFRIPHCRRRVAINRPKVPLAVYQHVTHREILRHPGH